MADKFGFNQVAKKMQGVTRRFLSKGVTLAQKEFKKNFDTQSSQESGMFWPALSYRTQPPPRLDLSGELKRLTLESKPTIYGNRASLIIDPIEVRNGQPRGYASYHEDGVNQYKSKVDFQSEFVTQSKDLYNKQTAMLINELDKAFL